MLAACRKAVLPSISNRLMSSRITKEEFLNALSQVSFGGPLEISVDALEAGELQIRLLSANAGRPGGTVNGPTIFALADLTAWGITMSLKGPKLLAVTSNTSIDFLRKPLLGRDLVGVGNCVKNGKSLVVSRISIFSSSEGTEKDFNPLEPVAIATVTYSLPPRPSL